jgi:hypothetical protein
MNPHCLQYGPNPPEPDELKRVLVHGEADFRPYASRRNEIKTTVHWGQRKLLVGEIEFIEWASLIDTPKVVVYAGAAPALHIPVLSSLYPDLLFILIDPRNFQICQVPDRIIIM